jgi:hypothetical protein
MPTSDPILLTPVIQQILWMQPNRILDIGIGCGKWGSLSREYTDIWHRRWNRSEWKTTIDGIEIYDAYKTPLWSWYDNITIGNATDLIKDFNTYDLIICIEVLEHIEKETAKQFIKNLLEKSKILLISFTNSEQGCAFGNIYEKHISKWNFSDFEKLGKSECLLSINKGNKQLIKIQR